jgi:hypothetical protein
VTAALVLSLPALCGVGVHEGDHPVPDPSDGSEIGVTASFDTLAGPAVPVPPHPTPAMASTIAIAVNRREFLERSIVFGIDVQ